MEADNMDLMGSKTEKNILMLIYNTLLAHFGRQHWWPADAPFEVVVGAILTQQASWKNVEKAISNLKKEKLLTPKRILKAKIGELERAVRPSGYFRQKSRRLKMFCLFLEKRHKGDLQSLFSQTISPLRNELLSVHGIGQETADSIILYAAEKPTFVVDAYTTRILNRMGVSKETRYIKIKKIFEINLPLDVYLFKELHALLVKLGKEYCRIQPVCAQCPMMTACGYGRRHKNIK